MKESSKKLNVGNSDFVHDIKMNFSHPGTCVGFAATKSGMAPDGGEVAKLEAELTALVMSGFFTMQIDKSGLGTTSDGHLLLVERDGTFDDALGTTHGHTRIMLGSPFNQVDPVKVTQPDPNVDVFEFTGPVVVWAHGVGGGGGEKSNRIIACGGAGDNKVTATINR